MRSAVDRHNRHRWELVAAIQAAFAWTSLPWQEPSERMGIDTSFGGGREDLLDLTLMLDAKDRCPHALHRGEFRLYLPVDFDQLRVVTTPDFEEVAVGSSVRLRAELALLETLHLARPRDEYEGQREEIEAEWDRWERETFETYVQAARESIELNLPILIGIG